MLNEIGWAQSQLSNITKTKTASLCDIPGSNYVDIKYYIATETIAYQR